MYIYIYIKEKLCMIIYIYIYIYPVLKCFERMFHHGLQPVMCRSVSTTLALRHGILESEGFDVGSWNGIHLLAV